LFCWTYFFCGDLPFLLYLEFIWWCIWIL